MHLRSAKLVDLKMFKQAFEASPKAAFQSVVTDESGKPSGREVAVYTNSGPAGEIVGIMTWKDALIVLADVKNYSFLKGEAARKYEDLARFTPMIFLGIIALSFMGISTLGYVLTPAVMIAQKLTMAFLYLLG